MPACGNLFLLKQAELIPAPRNLSSDLPSQISRPHGIPTVRPRSCSAVGHGSREEQQQNGKGTCPPKDPLRTRQPGQPGRPKQPNAQTGWHECAARPGRSAGRSQSARKWRGQVETGKQPNQGSLLHIQRRAHVDSKEQRGATTKRKRHLPPEGSTAHQAGEPGRLKQPNAQTGWHECAARPGRSAGRSQSQARARAG